jgi:hypothetical protein
MADGCTTHPVGYVEGWFVDPDVRQRGVGRGLVQAAEKWAASQGCKEMASDAHLENSTSITAHKALGFREDSPCVRFRKWLPTSAAEPRILTLEPVAGRFAACRLDPDAPIPKWAKGPLISITRTPDELSVVCREEFVPDAIRCERGWRCLRVAGTMDFSLVGVLASLLKPLAEAGIAVVVVSTFDTDYLLVKDADFDRAVAALTQAGHVLMP